MTRRRLIRCPVSLVRYAPRALAASCAAATMLHLPLLPAPASGQSSGAAAQAAQAAVVEPRTGSAERTAILDAVRRAVQTRARFRVHHLRSTGRWAFFHGTEVVELDGDELQETDLDVAALLERRGSGASARWVVVEHWTLPTEEEHPRARFLERVGARRKALRLPDALFPSVF